VHLVQNFPKTVKRSNFIWCLKKFKGFTKYPRHFADIETVEKAAKTRKSEGIMGFFFLKYGLQKCLLYVFFGFTFCTFSTVVKSA
jgi:hypothetical protein